MKDAYTTRDLAAIMGVSVQRIHAQAKAESWQSRPRKGRGGGHEWLVSSMPEALRIKLLRHEEEAAQAQALPAPDQPTLATAPVAEAKKGKALAKADLVSLYVDWLKKAKTGTKAAARENFVLAYQGGAWPRLLEILGPSVSWQSIERWKVSLRRRGSVVSLVDRRGEHNVERRVMTETHVEILLRAVLLPNAPTISSAVRMAVPTMQAGGLIPPSEATMRRFLHHWQSVNFGTWVYTRQGKKAWNDLAAFYIDRDYSRIQVGDILVADGHVLNFEVINPWTGKPQRMELVAWYDMASNCPLGWEILPTENVQAIAAAFRRACMTLGKYPRIAYLDNGKAFRAKYFHGVDFRQTGMSGLFGELGIHTIFAWPYHGQSKTIERFFGTLHDLEQWTPSYVGRDIESKPPRLHRGEPLHRKAWEAAGGRALTLEEAHVAVARWIDEYINRPQRGHLRGKCPAEVFLAGRGPGVDERQLRHLMLGQRVTKITRDGIKMFGRRYYAPELYSRTHSALVRYDLQDSSSILVYDATGKTLLCEATRVAGIHPAASMLGDEQDRRALQQAIDLKKAQEHEASSIARGVLDAALADQRRRMTELSEATRETAAVEAGSAAPNLPPSKVRRIESAVRKAREERVTAARDYTPPAELPHIISELDKYEYLFGLAYRDGLTLREPDREFMAAYEAGQEYREVAQARFEGLARLYARRRAKA